MAFGPGNYESIDWLVNLDNAFPISGGTDTAAMPNPDTPAQSEGGVENLLQASFDTWTALEGSIMIPMQPQLF